MAACGSPAPNLLARVLLCLGYLCQPSPLTLSEFPLWYTVSFLLTNLISGTQEATDQAAPSQGQFTPVEARSMMGKMPCSPHKDRLQHGGQWMPHSALQSCLFRSHIKPDAGSAQGQVCHQIRPNADKGPILQAGLQACISELMKEPT